MKLTKTKLAAAAAIAALGLGAAMPASADLLLRVTDQGSGLSFTCVDQNAACDTNNSVGAIGLDAAFANAALGGGRGFNVESASATVLNTATQAQIDQSGNITRVTAVAGFLSIFFDVTFDGFTLPNRNPRTLSTTRAIPPTTPPCRRTTIHLTGILAVSRARLASSPPR